MTKIPPKYREDQHTYVIISRSYLRKMRNISDKSSTEDQNTHYIINKPFFLTIVPFNPLTPNGHYSSRTAPLTSKRCILNIYSTNIRTEYFKHAA
jgi:hypothetical protein